MLSKRRDGKVTVLRYMYRYDQPINYPVNNRMNLNYLPFPNERRGGEVVCSAGPGDGGTPSTPINPADLSK